MDRIPVHLQRIILTLAIVFGFTLIFQDIAWGIRLAVVLTALHLAHWAYTRMKERRNEAQHSD